MNEDWLNGTECRLLKYDADGRIKYWRGMSGANRDLVKMQRKCVQALLHLRCVNKWKLSSAQRDEFIDNVAAFERVIKHVESWLDGSVENALDAANIELKMIFKSMDRGAGVVEMPDG